METSELQSVASGFQAATVLLAANHLGITALLSQGPLSTDDVAVRLGLDGRAVRTVCEALVPLGVLVSREGKMQVTAPLREALNPDSAASLVHILRHQWHLLGRWSQLDRVVRSGQPVPRPADDAEQRRAFILAMADLARSGAKAVWEAVDLTGRSHLVDVGGGPGELAIAALERFGGLHATVFDRAVVLDIAREYAGRRGGTGRLSFQPGDALTDPVPGCDVALVSALLHSYGEQEVRRIAANVAAGVAPGGLVVIREFMWDDEAHRGPLSTALFAVNMLVGTQAGRCWTVAEIETIFGEAGFGRFRTLRLDARSSLVVGERLA
jgi:hypothetical protein